MCGRPGEDGTEVELVQRFDQLTLYQWDPSGEKAQKQTKTPLRTRTPDWIHLLLLSFSYPLTTILLLDDLFVPDLSNYSPWFSQ